MLWKFQICRFLRGINDTIGALLESCLKLWGQLVCFFAILLRFPKAIGTYQRNYFRRFSGELVRQFFIIGDQMCNVDITVVLLNEHVFADLVTNNKIGQLSVCADPGIYSYPSSYR